MYFEIDSFEQWLKVLNEKYNTVLEMKENDLKLNHKLSKTTHHKAEQLYYRVKGAIDMINKLHNENEREFYLINEIYYKAHELEEKCDILRYTIED